MKGISSRRGRWEEREEREPATDVKARPILEVNLDAKELCRRCAGGGDESKSAGRSRSVSEADGSRQQGSPGLTAFLDGEDEFVVLALVVVLGRVDRLGGVAPLVLLLGVLQKIEKDDRRVRRAAREEGGRTKR